MANDGKALVQLAGTEINFHFPLRKGKMENAEPVCSYAGALGKSLMTSEIFSWIKMLNEIKFSNAMKALEKYWKHFGWNLCRHLRTLSASYSRALKIYSQPVKWNKNSEGKKKRQIQSTINSFENWKFTLLWREAAAAAATEHARGLFANLTTKTIIIWFTAKARHMQNIIKCN